MSETNENNNEYENINVKACATALCVWIKGNDMVNGREGVAMYKNLTEEERQLVDEIVLSVTGIDISGKATVQEDSDPKQY